MDSGAATARMPSAAVPVAPSTLAPGELGGQESPSGRSGSPHAARGSLARSRTVSSQDLKEPMSSACSSEARSGSEHGGESHGTHRRSVNWDTRQLSLDDLRTKEIEFSRDFTFSTGQIRPRADTDDGNGRSHSSVIKGGQDLTDALKNAAQLTKNAAVAHNSALINRVILEELVKENKRKRKGCMMLIFCSIYFTVYIAVSSIHLEIMNSHLLEQPLRDVLRPPIDSALEISDVWNFIDNVFVPVFFRQHDSIGNELPRSEWSRVFMYDQLRGAAVLTQVRSEVQPCMYDMSLSAMCHPQFTQSAAPFGLPLAELPNDFNWSSVLRDENEGFEVHDADRRLVIEEGDGGWGQGRRLRQTREEVVRWLPQFSNQNEFPFSLIRTTPLADLKKRIEYLRLRGWLDEQTSVLAIKVLVLNSELDGIPRLLRVRVEFQFSRGGGVFGSLRIQMIQLEQPSTALRIGMDAAFLLLVVIEQCWAIIGLYRACRSGRVTRHVKQPQTIFHLGSVVLSLFVVMGMLVQLALTEEVRTALEEGGGALEGASLQETGALDEATDTAAFFIMWYNLLVTYYNIFLMFRLFVGLEFQPRLAVVMHTLRATSVDLAHFLVILVPTFLAYAIAGTCIFGRRIDEFASIERAVGTCFKIAIESEFDWAALAAEDYYTAMSWVWSFVVLVCLILLNMVLAIIMDVYTDVRFGSDSEETLWQSLTYCLQRFYLLCHGHSVVSSRVLLQRLRSLPEVITQQELSSKLPDMHPWEFSRLVNAARGRAKSQVKTEARSTATSSDMTAAVKLGVDRVCRLVKDKRDRIRARNASVGRPGAVCVEDILQSLEVQRQWTREIVSQVEHLEAHIK